MEMKNMKVKCIKCETVEDLSKEDIEFLISILRKYNSGDIVPSDYISLLSVVKGRCTDDKKHIFIYDEEFTKNVADLIDLYNNLCADNAAREKELSEILQKIENYKKEIGELSKSRYDKIAEVDDINAKINKVLKTFEETTGTNDVKMWS